jgi:hypothetical protein
MLLAKVVFFQIREYSQGIFSLGNVYQIHGNRFDTCLHYLHSANKLTIVMLVFLSQYIKNDFLFFLKIDSMVLFKYTIFPYLTTKIFKKTQKTK